MTRHEETRIKPRGYESPTSPGLSRGSQKKWLMLQVSLHLMSVSSDSGFEVNAVYLEADGQIAKYYFQLTGQGTQFLVFSSSL